MSTQILSIAPAPNGFAVSIPGEALRLKDQAIASAKQITSVLDASQQEKAIAVVSTLKALLAGVETTREDVKRPYLEAGRAIDAKAKEYAKELAEQAKAIEFMIAAFQRIERERVEKEQRRIEQERKQAAADLAREQEKAAAAERARIAAEQAAAEAERRRVQAELDAAEAKGAAAKKKAEAERKAAAAASEAAERARKQAESDAMQAEIDAAEAQDAAAESDAIVTTAEPPKATGASIRVVMDFEVTDIEAFAEWDRQRRLGKPQLPSFVKIEVRKGDFRQYLNVIGPAVAADIPGITVSEETKAAVRAATPGSLQIQ